MPQAGMQVLREAGVTKGTDQELQAAAAEYDGHALALSLLGSYLATVYDGEIRKRDLIPQLTEGVEHGGHAKRVMESYETWLRETAELEILYLMGLFDRPAPLGAIDVLIKQKRIKGLIDKLYKISEKDWRYAIKHLRDLRLLSASEADTLDCHPLIREHFSEKLKAKSKQAWKEAHSRLYDYYKNLPKKELPDTLEQMEPLFAAVAHGCQAGKHQEALLNVFWERIRRKNEQYSYHKLGAFGADQAALSNFFEVPWRQPASGLSDGNKAGVLNFAGFGLRALGRLREAAQPMQAAVDNFIKQKDWKQVAINAGNLSELYLTLGEVEAAVSSARQSVDFSEKSEDQWEQIEELTTLAEALHVAGEIIEAESNFRAAENLLGQPLCSGPGYRFCELMISQGRYKEVNKRTNLSLEIIDDLLPIALDKLSLGRAYLLEALASPSIPLQRGKIMEQAADYLNQAVAGLREAGTQDHQPRAFLARAFFYRIQNQFPQAWDDLEEAREIAERGSMNLWLVDYHLEASRLLISEFGFQNEDHQHAPPTVETFHETSLQRADDHLKKAAELVQKTGYHRRDPEVELGYAGLFFAQGDQVKAREHLGTAKTVLDKMGIRCWDFWVREMEGNLTR